MAITKTGVKITVDTSELDIKFTKSVEKLNASISKSQKALGLFYNDQGLLSNKLGQCVEGLSQQQIKLGQYVDELGNVRTMQGGFTEGLSKTQLALGMYADEVGNVYDITGKLVGQTDKAAKKLEKEAAEAAKKAAQEMEELKRAAQKTANELNEIGDKLDIATGQLGALGGNLRALGGALENDSLSRVGDIIDVLSNTQAAIANIKSLSKSITELASNMSKAKTATGALKAGLSSLGGKAALVIGALVLVHETLNMIAPLKEVKDVSEDFKTIEERAKSAKDEIKDLYDALKYGALSAAKTEADTGRDQLKRVKELKEEYKEAERQYKTAKYGILALAATGAVTGAIGGSAPAPGIGTVIGGIEGAVAGAATGGYITWRAHNDLKATENDYKNAMAEASKFIESYVNEARAAEKTQQQKIKENIEAYELVKAVQVEHKAEAEKAGESQEEITRLLADIALVDKKIAALKEEERKAAIEASGMSPYLEAALNEQKKTAPTIREFNDIVDKWKALEKEGAATQEEINSAIKKKQEEVAGQLAALLGVEAPKTEELHGRYAIEAERLREKLSRSAISVDQFAQEMDALRAKAKDAPLKDSLKDLENRYNKGKGQIDADQYAELVKAVKEKNAENLLEKLDGYDDANKAVLLIERELKAGRITKEQEENAKAKLIEIKERYADILAEEVANSKNAKTAREKIQSALERDMITESQSKELLSELYDKTESALKDKFKDVDLSNSKDAADAWKKAMESGTITQEAYNEELEKAKASIPYYDSLTDGEIIDPFKEYNDIIKNLVKQREKTEDTKKQDRELERLLKDLGNTDAVKESLGEYNDAIKRITTAYENEIVNKEERDKLQGEATSSLIESLNKEKAAIDDATAKRKKSLRDSLGVDSYLESLKTPAKKYNEAVDKINEALKEGAINRKEAAAMKGKAQDEYWQQLDKLTETAQKGAEKIEKLELGQSSYRGSESLYLAMVKNSQANFQKNIQDTTGRIANYQSQAVYQSQLTNAYLATIATAGALPVFRG